MTRSAAGHVVGPGDLPPAPARARRRSLVALLALLAGPVLLAVGATPSRASEPTTRAPLRVTIATLAPAVIPDKGPITLTGTITNRSKDTWTNLQAYLLISGTPIRSRSELAQAAASDPTDFVGGRLAGDGLYDSVGDLAPGASVPYRVSVRRQDLGIAGTPGVYWVGIHVLGADNGGRRDAVADGRARTFMPLVPQQSVRAGTRTRLSLVVPVKEPVHRGAAGRLLGLPQWQQLLGTDGRLDRLLSLSGRASAPITWVVDPAVLDAARSVAHDNPEVDTGPTDGSSGSGPSPSPTGPPSPTASSGTGAGTTAGASPGTSTSPAPSTGSTSSASGSPSASPGAGATDTGSSQTSADAQAAQRWLDELQRQAPGHAVLAVPYGDLDVASVLDSRQRALYAQGTQLSTGTLASYGLDNVPIVVAPTSGLLPGSALRRIAGDTTVLLSSDAYPDATTPVLRQTGRAPVVLSDAAAGAGGPAPGLPHAALAERQRILSEAALHAMSTDRAQPLVVSTPAYWNPGPAWSQSDFFAGLDQPWLRLVGVPDVVDAAPLGDRPLGSPTYPARERREHLPPGNLQAARRLSDAGSTFAELLTHNDTVDADLAKVALLAASTGAREAPGRAQDEAASALDYVQSQLRRVRVEGPQFVMMSSQDGPIDVKLVNDLDQTVTVALGAHARTEGLTVTVPKAVTLGPGERTAVRIQAHAHGIGVHAVTVYATTEDGRPLGNLTQFNVRTSHVGVVVWTIMAAGGVLLFTAILVRLWRRVRRRKATHGPLLPRDRAEAATADPADPSGPHERPGHEVGA